MTISYVYKWTHLPTMRWYIGSRTKIDCHPDDGYICSSKLVRPMVLSAPHEWKREILFTGGSIDVLLYETKMLCDLDAKNNPQSFNMHNGDGQFTTAGVVLSKEWRQKISKSNRNKKRSDKARENYRRANSAKAKDPAYREKLRKPKPKGHSEKVSAALKGKKKSIEHCKAMSAAKKGKKTGPCSERRRDAIRQALKGKHTLPLISCPHCGLLGRSNMKRWHFDNCKNKDK